MLGFARDIDRIRRLGLHAIRHLERIDSRCDFRIADFGKMLLIERVHRVERAVLGQELLEVVRRRIEAELALVRLQARLAAADLRVAGQLAGEQEMRLVELEGDRGLVNLDQAAGLAAERRIEMSSHLFPEVSAHLLAATPTRHFLEYMDWADCLVQEPLRIVDGYAVIPERPGNGLVWDQAAVARFRM